MTRLSIFCLLTLAACGDNLTPPAPNDAGPIDAPVPPTAEGEYAIKISPVSFVCYGVPQQTYTLYRVADVVPQEDPWKFDLRSSLQGTFIEYDRYNLTWEADGWFSDDRVDNVSFGPGIVVKAKRFVEGSVTDASLHFFHSYDLGIDMDNGAWDSFCLYEANIDGARRYAPWDGEPRANIDGQWRVKKTVIASPLVYPTDLPYAHFLTMDTLAQADQGAVFAIREIRGAENNYLRYVNRDPITGAVNASITLYIPGIINGETRTTVYETKLWGTLLPDTMNLEFSWEWSTAETGEVHWFQHEHYEGVPRYQEHNPLLAEPPAGAYNAEYTLMKNDCGDDPYTEHRVLDVLPADNGDVLPQLTNLGIEPTTHLGTGGALTMTFSRHTSDKNYFYAVNGTIDGHAVNLTMMVTILNNIGVYQCTGFYQIAGQKRYESYR